jgi:thiamine pyrophosphate-dependent acetolactate synthase large subunit-like protein
MAVTTGRARTFEVIADAILDSGVTTVFGLMGEDTAKLVTTLAAQPGLTYHSARHESMAVAMADGYARASGRLGVAVLSRGPGLVNGLTAAVAARKHGSALLVIAGDSPVTEREAGLGKRNPKHVAQAQLLEACGLRPVEVTPRRVREDVREAIALACSGIAVCLNVPTDLFDTPVSEGSMESVVGRKPDEVIEPTEADVSRLTVLLDASKRPLLLAGRGAIDASGALRELAEHCGALLSTSLLAKDLFADDEFDIGVVGGFAGDVTRTLLAERDLVVAFGASLNSYTTGGGELFSRAKLVRVDHDPDSLREGPSLTLGVVADAAATAARLRAGVRAAPGRRTDRERALVREDRRRLDFTEESVPHGIDPRRLLRELDAILPADRALVLDAGAFIGFASRYLSVSHPSRFTFCLDFAAIGLGHGTALGTALARPDTTTVLCIGDGGLMMTLGELETAVRRQVPLVVIVLDDGAYGAERHYLDLMGIDHAESQFGLVPFARLAETLGMPSTTVRTADDLALARSLLATGRRPVLIDCKINGAVRPAWLEELFTGTGFGR